MVPAGQSLQDEFSRAVSVICSSESSSGPSRSSPVLNHGIVPFSQPEGAQRAIRAQLETATDWDLGGLSAVAQATGSLALGLAVAAGRLGGEEAWRLSQIDETYQSEGWGEDEATAARRRLIRHDLETAARFLFLCRG